MTTERPPPVTIDDVLRFNWQDAPEGFLRWLLPTVVGELATLPGGPELYDRLTDATEAWTRVELGVTVNGVAVPTGELVVGLERWVADTARDVADAWLRRNAALSETVTALEVVQRVAAARLRELALAAGLDLDEDDS